MKNFLGSLIILGIFITASACLVKAVKPTDPCRSKEFVDNLARYTQEELTQLEKILKNSSYPHSHQYGCQAAFLGKLYITQNRFSDASSAYGLAAERMPELRDYFLLSKAKAEFKAGHLPIAKQIAQSLLKRHQSGKLKTRIQELLADIALATKDDQEIIATHRQIAGVQSAANENRLFNLAQSLSKIGELAEADEVFKELLIRFPTSEEAKNASKLTKNKPITLSLEESEKRFNKLISKLAFDQIIEDAEDTLKTTTKDKENERSIYNSYVIKSLILNNKLEEGLKRAEARAQAPDATAKDLENYAWSLGKADRYVEASDYYSRFTNRVSDKKDKARGCFFAGFSLYEASLYQMALFTWEQCAPLIDEAQKENFQWYQAFSAMLSDRYDKAASLLRELVDHNKSSEKEKYVYFLGYALHKLHKKNAGDVMLRELAYKTTPSYYVLLARQFLGLEALKGQKLSAGALEALADKCNKAACKNALTLYHLGFAEEARDMIVNGALKSDEKLAMLQHMGNFHEVWQRSYLVNAKLAVNSGKLSTDYRIRASYPLPHQNVIEEMSRKYSVPQNLLYAIIRTESGFAPDAESYRGALGLMQMMPFVASDLAQKVNLPEFNVEQLKEPKVSLELGTLFISTLKRQFQKNKTDATHLVVAAYNAGPEQVQKWLTQFGHLPKDLFVERIPFEQTRSYVRKVLSSASFYNGLNGKPLSLSF